MTQTLLELRALLHLVHEFLDHMVDEVCDLQEEGVLGFVLPGEVDHEHAEGLTQELLLEGVRLGKLEEGGFELVNGVDDAFQGSRFLLVVDQLKVLVLFGLKLLLS